MGASQDDRGKSGPRGGDTDAGATFESLQSVSAFELGRLAVTSNASTVLGPADILAGLARHARGDWGDLDDGDRRANDEALVAGERILSSYRAASGREFWVITEADRSATTVLLPEDY